MDCAPNNPAAQVVDACGVCGGDGSSCAGSENTWDISLSQSFIDCAASQVCYHVDLQSASGQTWALGDQNYRFFYDADLMTIVSVTSLLPSNFYGSANIDQNTSIAGQQASSPLDEIDDNLGFLDFSIIQTDRTNPSQVEQIEGNTVSSVAEICVEINDGILNGAGNSCASLYHSRPSTAGTITNQYTTITENDAPNSTTETSGNNFNDMTAADGDAACLDAVCSMDSWDISLSQSFIDCAASQVCYHVDLQSASGQTWALGDQNYRFFYDADLMTIVSVTSLLPSNFYGSANIDQNTSIAGQQASSPLDEIDDNLGFLDFSIIQTDRTNPSQVEQIEGNTVSSVAEICVEINDGILNGAGNSCASLYHSRPSTAGTITNQYTTITENDAPNSTTETSGNNFNDMTAADGDAACLDAVCSTASWNIDITSSNIDCTAEQVCYQVRLQSANSSSWTLGDQNYRLFFDGDLMTVTSVRSLLPPTFYDEAIINQNIKVSGQGQESSSPLDNIDDNLGFLDFVITQNNRSNPPAATQINALSYIPVAEICVDAVSSVFENGGSCLTFLHSRPSTAGTFTNQYTTITENDAPNSTLVTQSNIYNDLDANDTEACPSLECLCTIDATRNILPCSDNGTPTNPNDDTFAVVITATAINGSSQYSVSDGSSNWGPFNYGTAANVDGLIANGNTITLTLTDVNDVSCSTTISVSQNSCSDEIPCDITDYVVSNITCDDNNTPDNPQDDTFTFTINVAGVGINGWDGGGTSGLYNEDIQVGPFDIYCGDVQFTLTSKNCSKTLEVNVVAPPACSVALPCNTYATIIRNNCCKPCPKGNLEVKTSYREAEITSHVSYHKPTNGSSKLLGSNSSSYLAVDGDEATIFQTALEENPWWEIDLIGNYDLSQIVINSFNSDTYTILISNTPFSSYDFATAQAQADNVIMSTGEITVLNTTGRFIRIYKQGFGQLQFSNIDVLGTSNATSNPYSYTWSDPQVGNIPDPTCLESGTYNVTVTDTATGCSVVKSYVVE